MIWELYMKSDDLFNEIADYKSFIFDRSVAEVFDDMAKRSIPGYATQQLVIAEYVCRAIQLHNALQESNNHQHTQCAVILDLGCSTGETIHTITNLAKRQNISLSTSKVIASDASVEMLDECKKKLAPIMSQWQNITIRQLYLDTTIDFGTDVHTQCTEGVLIIILHFVLQFISPHMRMCILQQCWSILKKEGVLLIGEKTRNNDTLTQSVWEKMQYYYKRSFGYSDTQIESKKRALEGILVPERVDVFESMLTQLPNSKVELYYAHGEFRCYAVRKTK